MVVSWRKMNTKGYLDSDNGHVIYILDKGVDSQQKTYLKVMDVNYAGTGQARVQTVWSDSMGDLIYPGMRAHSAIIRPEMGFGHGREVASDDKFFGKQILIGEVDERRVFSPTVQQSVLNKEGIFDEIVSPGIAVAQFGKEGLVMSVDNTHVLESGAVNPGSALRPFIYTYMRLLNPYMSEKNQDLVDFIPAKLALDGSDVVVTNTASMMMNLTRDDLYGSVDWRQALAVGFDVPFQRAMKELLEKDPTQWMQFQRFLGRFGLELCDSRGNILQKPTPLVGLGRDCYVKSLDALGYGLSVMANAKDHFDPEKDSILIKELDNVRDILLDDIKLSFPGTIREQTIIRGVKPEDEVGQDLFQPSILNGTTSFEFAGKKALYVGSYYGQDTTAYIVEPQNGEYIVTVARARSDDLRASKLFRQSGNIMNLANRAVGIGSIGFPAITAKLALTTD
jgi:hypothetical protein